MCENQKPATRFRHHFLSSGSVLTICTRLNYDTHIVEVGWSLFNHEDDRWIRRYGNQIARDRMNMTPLTFSLTVDEPVLCDYISLKSLMLVFIAARRSGNHQQEGTPQVIPRAILQELQFEMLMLINLLGERLNLPPIFEE